MIKKTLFALFMLSVVTLCAQDFSKVEIRTQPVKDNIHVLFGEGGNIGVLSGPDGFVLIDNQFAPLSEKIKAALAEMGDGAVTFTINTHFHFDHADGNKAFGPEGTWIVAHANTRKRLMQDNRIGVGEAPRLQEKYPDEAVPKITFENVMTLHLNGQTVRIFHPENAHTDTDAIVYFPDANVLHTGDVFVRYGVPFIDLRNGGSVRGMIKAANQLIELCNEETIIIPGHGQLSGKKDIVAFRDMLQDIWDAVAAAVSEGKSIEDIIAHDPTEKYKGGSMGAIVIQSVFAELQADE